MVLMGGFDGGGIGEMYSCKPVEETNMLADLFKVVVNKHSFVLSCHSMHKTQFE